MHLRSPSRAHCLLATLALATLAFFALPTSAAAQISVAVLDVDRAFAGSPEAKDLEASIRKLESDTKAELDKMAQEAEQLRASGAGQPAAEVRRIQQDLEDLQLKSRRQQEQAQRQAGEMQGASLAAWEERFKPIFDALVSEGGFDLVLNRAQGIVLFAGEAIDLTDRAIAKLNE